jgi:hypothetical protein
MVFGKQRHLHRLASVFVSSVVAAAAAAAAAAALALAAAAAAVVAAAAVAAVAAAAAAAAAERTERLLHRHLRPMHRRSERPELHSLAQLSVKLRQRSGVLHHVDRARHWKAPDSNLLPHASLPQSPHT